jgi:uncharacterized metal-binding protein YceD (DUF177 family)
MIQPFKIYIDRLRGGHEEKISETIPPDFLEIHEKDLVFSKPVVISGESYLSGDHLVIKLKIETEASIPCTICNEPTPFPIVLNHFYLTVALDEIKTHVFDCTQEIREAILLQVPPFIECHEGQCPEREVISKYLKPF